MDDEPEGVDESARKSKKNESVGNNNEHMSHPLYPLLRQYSKELNDFIIEKRGTLENPRHMPFFQMQKTIGHYEAIIRQHNQ